MNDLVKRLSEPNFLGTIDPLRIEAADRIEQLETQLRIECENRDREADCGAKLVKRIEQLEERLEFLLEERTLLTKGLGQERGKQGQEDGQPLDGTVKFPL